MLKVTKITFDGQHIEYETESGIKYYDPNVEARAVAKAVAKELQKYDEMHKNANKPVVSTSTYSGSYGPPDYTSIVLLTAALCIPAIIFVAGFLLWFICSNFWFFLGAIAIDAIFFGILIIKVLFD